ncbi:MAG: MATE family efflux transporter [Thermoplasmata archaeon]|nr:MATE family efflux transporter [Thermoplasmata archaeon]
MSSNRKVDILLGDPKKAIIAMAIPIMVALFVAEINTVVDRAWCSGMGSDTLAAVAVVRPIYNVLVGLGTGLGVGASAVISRNIGAGKDGNAKSGCVQTIILAAAIGLVLTPILLILQPYILSALGANDVIDESAAYMNVYSTFVTLIILNGAIGGILNGQGASTLSTAMMVTLAASNIILDPMFIYVLDMGVMGASLATIVATTISLLLGLYFIHGRRTYLQISKSDMRWDRIQSRAIMTAGFPQMLEFIVLYGMDAVLNFLVIVCAGTDGLTIFSTVDGLIILMTVPAMAVGSALVPVASSAYGQKNIVRLNKSFRYALIMGIGLVTALILVLELFPEQLLYLFTYSDNMEAYRPEMVHLLSFMCLYMPLFSFNPICSGYLQAVKHPNYSVVMAVVRNLILITFFWIATSYTLDAIGIALIAGHFVGMTLMCTLTYFTSRGTEREMNLA